MKLTDKFIYEDEIERLNRTVKRQKKEIEEMKNRQASFASKTYKLLKLFLTDKDISEWFCHD